MAETASSLAAAIRPHLPAALDLRFSAAEKFFAKKVTLTRAEFNALAAEAQVFAFTVARIQSIELISDIQKEIQRAMIEGTTLADFQKNAMPGLMAKHGWSGLTPWHTETVFRTNMQMAYGAGQLEGLRAVKEDFPYWQYVAINDGRVRPSHLALNRRVYPADHEFWRVHYPPWGYNCRCDVIPMLAEEVGPNTRIHTDDGPPPEGNFHGPGSIVDTLKTASPQEIAQQFMPRIDPTAAAALMRKLDTDQPLPLKLDGVPDGGRLSLPPPPVVRPAIPITKGVTGPTAKEIDDALAENELFDKKAKRAAQIKAAQAKYAAKVKAAKEAAKKAANEIDVAHGEALVEDAKRTVAARIAALRKKYPLQTKDLPDETIAKHLFNTPEAELAAREAAIAAHRKAYVLGPLSKEEIAKLTAEERAMRRADQIARSREAAKARAAAERAARAAGGTTAPKGGVTVPLEAPAPTTDPLRRLSTLNYQASGTHGVPVQRDGPEIEGHSVNIRIVETAGGKQFYEFYGKTANDNLANAAINGREWHAAGPRRLYPSAQGSHIFREGTGKLTPYHTEGQAETLGSDRLRTRTTPQGNVELRVSSERWYEDISKRGGTATTSRSFVIRIPRTGSDTTDFASLQAAVKDTPLEAMLEATTPAEARRAGLIRAIVQQQPTITQPGGDMMILRGIKTTVRSDTLWKMTEADLISFAKENRLGINADTVGVRSMPKAGYVTHTIKRNMDYDGTRVFHGTKGDGKYVAQMIDKGAVLSSYHRARAGYGGLTTADDRTGGSDSLFTRIFNREGAKLGAYGAGKVRFKDHGFSGNYQFVWKAQELERLDVYAFNADRYGRTYTGHNERKTPEAMSRMKKHHTDNEAMFRYGIDFTNLDFIATQSESLRQSLLTELRRRGITTINGRAIEEVVKVRTYLTEVWEP